MPCPFPGMDPFLEMQPFWGDFAPKFLGAMGNALLPQLLPKYDVRVEEYVSITCDHDRLRRVQPDVTIVTTDRWPTDTGAVGEFSSGSTAFAEATVAELDYPELEPRKQRRLSVIHRESGRVVTVMELLSMVNKTPWDDGLGAYLAKRAELLSSETHLIELDLHRGGQRLPMAQQLPEGDYYAFIGRRENRPHCQVIAWRLPTRLPTIPIPLLVEYPEATLDLAAAFATAYEPSLYDRRLPYDRPLSPRLTPQMQEWVNRRLKRLNSDH